MRLNPNAREYYELQITTTATDGNPIPASGWEASFDKGVTWYAATVITHDAVAYSAWLLAGIDADPGTAVMVLPANARIVPLVRAVDNPEIVVRQAPTVVSY